MGVTIFRPGQRLVIPGVTVMQPRPSAVAGSWWDVAGQTCIAAYAAKGAADLAASYINLANPGTYNAAPGVAPTWDSTGGWTFNGTTQYLTTGIVPAPGWSAIIRFSDATNGGRAFGMTNTNGFYIRPADGGQVEYMNGAAAATKTPALTGGVLAIAGNKAYRNGADEGITLTAWSGTTSTAMSIGARNVAINFFAAKIQALAIYSTTLSAGDVATLTTAMNAL